MGRYRKQFLAGCLLMTALFFLIPAYDCRAAGLEQTEAEEHAVTVRWDLSEDALRYLVYVGTCSADSRLYAAADASVMSMRIEGLAKGSSNYIRVDYEYEDASGAFRTKTAGYTASAMTLPGKVKNVRQTSWYDRAESCSVSWDRMGSADGYEYAVRNAKEKKIASGRVGKDSASVRINRIAASEICTVAVRSYITIGGKEIYGAWSSPCYLFAQPRVRITHVPGGGLKVQWRRIKGASGYQVYASWNGTGSYQKVKSVKASANSAVISALDGESLSENTVCCLYVTVKKKVGKQVLEGGRYFYQNTGNEDTGYFS